MVKYIESNEAKRSMRENTPAASAEILSGSSQVSHGKHLDAQKKGYVVCILHFSFGTRREEPQGLARPNTSLYRWKEDRGSERWKAGNRGGLHE